MKRIKSSETLRRVRFYAGVESAAQHATANRITHRLFRYTRRTGDTRRIIRFNA